jgi:hypothetical protein
MMDKLKNYLDYSLERALKTCAQVALATIGVTAAGILDVEWLQVLSVSALAGVMSLLTSVLTYDKAAE